jgi:hypothetical protein
MTATLTTCEPTLTDRAFEVLRQAGNPFRNYFARNPDDEVCARFHVPELFARERTQLLGVVDLYRATPNTHSEMVPVLGSKGAGKTHLLHSIKHGTEGAWQLIVTPGTFQKDTDFLEYLLFQLIDTLLSGGKQKGRRPLETVGEELGRRLLLRALGTASRDEQMDLFPAPGLARWGRRLGLGSSQAQERTQWLVDQLSRPEVGVHGFAPIRRLCAEGGVEGERVCELVWRHLDRTEAHNTAGLMRRHIHHGLTRAALIGDESELANFLTYGFAELEFKVQPSRQDLVLALFRVLMEVFQELKVPVVVAFDQLEDLLLARRSEDGHRIAESFFAGIVQAMHQLDGFCFLVFAERGLWNRFVPSLDGYIQDRLNNPVHLPGHGTIKSLRLEAPPPDLARRVVETRLWSALEALPESAELPPLFPFTEEQVLQVARTEPTLRDMLQQYRHLFDHLVYGEVQKTAYETDAPIATQPRIPELREEVHVKSLVVVETPANGGPLAPRADNNHPLAERADHHDQPTTLPNLGDTFEQEMQAAQDRLLSEGALTGATRELQLGLGVFLQTCFEHGVKVGPWRLAHVVPEWTFGEHPTYGVISIAHWVCRDGQPWKVGVGLFMGRGAGKPRDLEIKLSALELTPTVIDHLILLRPDDDIALTGKSKTVWQESERRGRQTRLEPATLASFAALYGFPRWLTALGEALPPGQPLPNLADLIQDRCEKLLEQVCMPVCP